ncbi:MAG TPA: S9 family peptidase [Thermoanaerobaculia bacterium]|nr:S9 family peptidase [Thermoanaerobaculia bacterium]
MCHRSAIGRLGHSRSLASSVTCSMVAAALLAVPAGLLAQASRQLTLEDLYSPDASRRLELSGTVPRVEWIDDQSWLQRPGNGDDAEDVPWLLVDAADGSARPFFDRDLMAAALAALPGMSEEQARRLARGRFQMSEDRTAALINFASDLFYYRFGDDAARRLTHDPAPEVGEELSPDGRFVSFVRDYDLHLIDLQSGRERALTADGGPELFYGRLDWVYQEEIYGRGNFKGYWWSPDSRHLTYLRLDESPVREFTVVDHIPTELELEVTNYPKAGAPNPTVTLGVVPAVGGETRWIDTTRYAGLEHLIVSVGWTPGSEQVVFQVQDREQRWLDLNLADPGTGSARTLFRETSPAFVAVIDEPRWLADGSFLWLSERTGFQHVYHYEADGTLRRQLTQGEWEARTLYGVDEKNGLVYFEAMEHDPIAPHLYRVPLSGGEPQRLSQRPGSHAAQFSPSFTRYVDTWSDVRTPPQMRLHRSDGRELRVVAENRVPELERFDWGEIERLQVETRDGFAMEAMLIKPPGFDPSRRYPVLQYNYGGPHAPVVRDAWGGTRYLWHQLLAQRGYVIWMCDNRSASGKGIAPTWEAYRRMGVIELRDIEDGVAWLKRQPWVDPERIGIWGWSYGGFMASYALTHSQSFKMGIAGAPVTDWRFYDSIYTERYMGRPQTNEEGYDETSVVEAAADLHGKLLLIHGTMDDNVHLQNTMRLVYELQKAGKDFDLMIYPKSRHGVREPELVYHLQRLMTDFVLENL